MLPAAPSPDKRASVFLTTPTKADLENGTATFICLAKEFSPEKHSFKWLQNGVVVKDEVDDCLGKKKTNITVYTATSVLQLKNDDWTKKPGTKITCTFDHIAGSDTKEATNTGL